jgi:hypothetical protein
MLDLAYVALGRPEILRELLALIRMSAERDILLVLEAHQIVA